MIFPHRNYGLKAKVGLVNFLGVSLSIQHVKNNFCLAATHMYIICRSGISSCCCDTVCVATGWTHRGDQGLAGTQLCQKVHRGLLLWGKTDADIFHVSSVQLHNLEQVHVVFMLMDVILSSVVQFGDWKYWLLILLWLWFAVMTVKRQAPLSPWLMLLLCCRNMDHIQW